jgi:hypothetical protein
MTWLGSRSARWLTAFAALTAVVAFNARRADAGVIACNALPGPHVYMQIGDTQQPLFKELGRALRDNTPRPITVIYVTSPSCVNIAAIYNDTPITTSMLYIPSTAENPSWTTSMAALPCTPPAGTISDIANSNVFISACDTNPIPADIATFNGPVQAYVFAVPEASTETVITAEEAYYVWGFGAGGMITPWDDETAMHKRRVTTSTLLSWAANIAVPPNKWKGVEQASSTAVVDALRNSTTPAKAIGILGAEVYDQFRNELDVLAFRGFRQWAAYYPDSSATALDKINVRDGHYTVWSPTVYLTRATAGVPDDADAKYVIDLVLGRTVAPAPNFNPTLAVIHNGLVPDCAMEVQRGAEGGDLSRYQPPEECVCYYEAQVATTTCATCSTTAQCTAAGGGVCRNGYCEEQ